MSSVTATPTCEEWRELFEERISAQKEADAYQAKISHVQGNVDLSFRRQLAKWRRKLRARQDKVAELTRKIDEYAAQVSVEELLEWRKKMEEGRREWMKETAETGGAGGHVEGMT